ncbi:glycosyltransferase 87 family protein [Actinomadura sp. 21ATH]|uniref:glycosyltransferase 87 family protein n=1 Tax=Actinomadura sp. 21ATH TaxID=1735444 RepID=UPI0035C174B5
MREGNGVRDAGVRRWARPPELLILLAGVAVAVATVAPIVVWWLTNPPDQRLVDLEVYRDGGRAILRGAPLYEVLTQPPQLLPFTYPPFASLLAVPFTVISWKAAQGLWMVLLYAALLVVVWYSFRDLIRRTGRWAPLTMGLLVGATAWMMPVFDQARFGQVGVLLMALCLADCVPGRTHWPRGLLVGLAVAIKLVPGVFLIYFLVTGRRDALANAVMTAGAATLGAFALLPSDSVDFWFGALLEGGDRTGAVNGTTNQAINGMVARIYLPDPFGSLVWLVLAALMAYFGFRMARRATLLGDALAGVEGRAVDARSLRLAAVAIVGLLSVLLSPVGWIHHLVWMVPVIGALVGDGRDTRRRLFAGVAWVWFLFPLPWWGAKLIGLQQGLITKIPGKIVQDAFGLAAVAMVVLLGHWLVKRIPPAEPGLGDPSHGRAEVGTLAP